MTERSKKLCSRARETALGRFTTWIALAFVLFAADQASKWYVQINLQWGEVRPVTSFFNWVLVGNSGSAFSFLGNAGGWQIWLFSLLASIVSAAIAWGLWRFQTRTFLSLSLSLLLAGALGNLVDRVTLGYVVDFLDFHALGWHWPAFNIADICICIGAAGIIIDEFMHGHDADKKDTDDTASAS